MSESSRSSLSPPLSAVSEFHHNMMPNETVDIQIYIPFLSVQKRIEVNLNDTVWSVKQNLLSNLTQVIPEGFNYGLFLPPCNGRAGKFLVDDRIFRDYPFNDCPPYLESILVLQLLFKDYYKSRLLKYKKRVYKSFNIDTKVYKRLHSKHSLKRFFDLCEKREAKKVESLCQIGLDPNFHGIHGETPLTWAASSDNNRDLIVALVAGGAHLDFRNLKSETPLHKAVFNATSANVKLLLDLGASAQCRDIRGLTPLYYACSRAGNNSDIAEMLLRDFADTGVTDTLGNTELHQACRNGLVGHLEHLLFYGADVDRQNLSGNTPMHTSVINNQVSCAKVLLFRNANAALYNRAGQTPYHVAIKMGSKELMQLLTAHEPQKAVPYRRPPRYNSKRRLTLSRAFLTQNRRKSISLFDQYSISEYGTINRTNDNFSNKLINNDESMSENGATYSPPCFSRRKSPLYDIVERMRIDSSNSANEVIETQNCDEEADTVEYTMKKLNDRRFSQPIHFDQLKIVDCQKAKEDCKRIIVIPRSLNNGFGFILRGAKKIETGTHFVANDKVPSLQFFEKIDDDGIYETKTLPYKRCSASSSNISNLTAFDDSFPICSSFSALPSTFKDPRSKVASVRNRAVNRRISAAELEILMDGEKRSVENEEKSPIPENRLKPQPNTQCKPVPSPKVYSSVAAMKRSSAPQPLKTGSTSTLSSSSSPSDQEHLSTFESNSNLSLILDDEDNRENSRKKATVCPEENNRHTNKVRKLSLRPKTPPPPPPTCEKTEDDTSNISHVENSEPTTSFDQNPLIKKNSRNSHRSRQKLEPSTGDFATDLKNALAKRRQKMGESSGISTLQLSSTEHESDDNHSQASSLTLSPPSARGEDASTNPESDNQGQNAVTLDHAVSGSVAASSARDSGYTSSRNSLEKSECSSSSYSSNSEKDEEKAISHASVSDDDIIVTSFSSKSSSLWAEKSVDRWTVEEVGFWLDSLYLSEYKRNFLRAEVDGARLLQFCRADFAKMGLTRIAHRLTIENALKSRKRFSPDASSRRL